MERKLKMNMKQKQKKNNGVSILELLTVLAIIVTLVGVTLVEFGRMDDKAQRNSSLVTLKGVAMALKMYKMDNGRYTCTYTDLYPYANMTSLRKSFILTPTVDTDDCTDFNPFTYLYISGTVKGIQPSYIVNYYLEPVKDPECSNGGVTPYPCKDKW